MSISIWNTILLFFHHLQSANLVRYYIQDDTNEGDDKALETDVYDFPVFFDVL